MDIDFLYFPKKKREELSLMKQYIATCRPSIDSGLVMRELEWRRHLIHSTTIFSLDDLCDIYNGTFLSKIDAVQEVLRNHIKVDCTVSIVNKRSIIFKLRFLLYSYLIYILSIYIIPFFGGGITFENI